MVIAGIWERYEELSPLSRIEVNLGALLIILCVIYWLDKFAKKRSAEQWKKQDLHDGEQNISNSLIKVGTDGVIYIYIAWWRYTVLAMLFLPLLYVLFMGMVNIFNSLPPKFWQHWSRDASLAMITAIGVSAVITIIVRLLIEGHKAVQMEIGKDYVRFRKSVHRGGIMLSDQYITVKYSEVIEIGFSKKTITGYVLCLKTAKETYTINLLLPAAEKAASYRLLEQATSNWQTERQKQKPVLDQLKRVKKR